MHWTGPTPPEHLDDLAVLIGRMSTDAPTGDLAFEPQRWDAERVRERDAVAVRNGVRSAVTAAQAPDGRLVAYTEASTCAVADGFASQGDTLVAPAHRGHRLGLWIKLANLELLLRAHPEVRAIDTFNADDNRWMVAINEQLGFRPCAGRPTGNWLCDGRSGSGRHDGRDLGGGVRAVGVAEPLEGWPPVPRPVLGTVGSRTRVAINAPSCAARSSDRPPSMPARKPARKPSPTPVGSTSRVAGTTPIFSAVPSRPTISTPFSLWVVIRMSMRCAMSASVQPVFYRDRRRQGTDGEPAQGLDRALPARRRPRGESAGIIIADTKFEFGSPAPRSSSADEVLTPDSSPLLAGRRL